MDPSLAIRMNNLLASTKRPPCGLELIVPSSGYRSFWNHRKAVNSPILFGPLDVR